MCEAEQAGRVREDRACGRGARPIYNATRLGGFALHRSVKPLLAP